MQQRKKIILIGATGTMGRHLTKSWEKDHDIIKVGSKSGDYKVDITSPESVEKLFQEVGTFTDLVNLAGPSHVGPWNKMGTTEFKNGLEGKLMGQINLVLIGQKYIQSNGSFTLIAGGLTYEPQLNFSNASAANGAIEAFTRAAAIELPKGIRINAVSPTVIEDSPQYFPFFPGELPVTMRALEHGFRKSVFGANTGKVIRIN